MRQEWEPEDLIEVWALLEEDQERLRNKSGANRLGFALLLKFFEVETRFPEGAGEIPVSAVSYVAQQVKGRRRSGPRTTGRGGRSDSPAQTPAGYRRRPGTSRSFRAPMTRSA
ncbi:DUF4158 domain-containing protein [Streptomyces sp. NPDC059851]|uniref:DUF4158 domain-containing protein n=1 Tax=Streptomyces sp. NPDC059851 TaxID=3346971 RepID=UPI0036489EDC